MEPEAPSDEWYREIKGDLFSCAPTDALVHCVSKDLSMSKGIAVEFKKRFGGVDELKQQNKPIGDVATLEHDQRFVFYMITKEKYFHKPTYANFESSLTNLRDKAVTLGIKRISMPKIGCGLDKLEWNRVSDMIKRLFRKSGIQITVYTL